MANMFETQVLNPFQALLYGQQSYDSGVKRSQENAKRSALQALMSGGGASDPNAVANTLLSSGDTSGAATYANLAQTIEQRKAQAERDARDFKFRQDEAQRTQRNADRSYGLQAQQNAFQREQAKTKPSIQRLKDAAGNESLVMVMPDGTSRPITQAEAAAAGGAGPNNPFAPDGKQTEGQANASLYARRMFESERILRDPKSVSAATSNVQRSIDQIPIVGSSGMTGLGNYVQSESYQKFDQAQRDFINATLRRESGAVISDAEFDNARQQYFPRPGDTKDVIAQKQRNRMEAIKGIAGAAGPAYRAPYTFDDKGDMQPYGKPAQQQQPQQQRLRFNPATGDFE